MLVYYNSEASPNCLKTKIVLLELGIEYEQRDFKLSELRGPFSDKFPNAKVPAIEEEGVAIAESGAIAMYLAEREGKLIPADRVGRALMHQALGFEASLQAPVIGGMGIFGELGRPEAERDNARLGRLMPEAARIAQVLGKVLGDRDYFAGEFSIADPQLFAGATKALAYNVFADPPANLVAWDARMRERPSVVEACKHYVGYR